ncbi:malto-oligosyltrehalose trehalohydrolase [Rhizobium pusense]|uniref:malto-oligosyltrehalose trehalohydrolase n=1 Tax=Agrobacterium pusense TaxID=648995 RepID=UPI000D1A3ECE|nr:malto-oligosyltrehalose trehalohydrolase [Agrobacterium pusense]MDH0911754.1 malto-oligosyltrehalose trehalohydrolase [Agrobacterium pusense]MDH1097825.1 malto-oligosyltrehalose trehalohydrolase [Agrobacterium pusense]MDH1114246.1 malto-oligosyltrehalose trehalohydrolase [Agrobacterium pusense]MDH2196376.1 malto-oligosyltrehalose trehalohydrolase [Agrobacterium pusense]
MNAANYREWGARRNQSGQTDFRIWAPTSATMKLGLNEAEFDMQKAGDGWHAITKPTRVGDRYCFVLEDGNMVPDPASHLQQEGPLGPSLIVNHDFPWKNQQWKGRPWHEAVVYELHIGTFTPEGTFKAAGKKLEYLADIGITAIEIMPLATFAGDRGWGYDGVLPFSPQRDYGSPDELKAFIGKAHGYGVMALLDVVYNHFGPAGNALQTYAPEFFKKDATPWGPAPDFNRAEVRSFFLQNALYWLQTYRFDGLRIDAADHLAGGDGDVDFLIELALEVRRTIRDRHVHLVIEDARNAASPMTPQSDSAVLIDAEWNDDFHHVIHVVATKEEGGIYGDFATLPYDKLRCSLATGFVYQGEPRPSLDFARSGEPSAHLPPQRFVNFLHNHDQAGNRLRGERLRALIPPPLFETLEAVFLLCPQTPLVFMGDDHGSTSPFFFFSDHPDHDHEQEIKNRLKQAEMFQGKLPPDASQTVRDPNDLRTMELSTLNWEHAESTEGKVASARMAALLEKRRRHIWPLLSSDFKKGISLDCEPQCLAINWHFETGRLQMRANLSENTCELPAVKGNIFHRHGGIDGMRYEGYAVQFAINA